jgi:hypothetical protein
MIKNIYQQKVDEINNELLINELEQDNLVEKLEKATLDLKHYIVDNLPDNFSIKRENQRIEKYEYDCHYVLYYLNEPLEYRRIPDDYNEYIDLRYELALLAQKYQKIIEISQKNTKVNELRDTYFEICDKNRRTGKILI